MGTETLLRALGADPAVFRPVYRVQKLMLRRRSKMVRRNLSGIQPFVLLCVMCALCGLVSALGVVNGTAFRGGGFGLTLGCYILLMIVLTDDADALVHPADHLALAAHPHDDRSLLLAKLAAIGRSLSLFSALLFLPPILTLLFARGPLASLGFLAGAAGAAVAVAAGGLLFAVLLVRLLGRQKMERLLSVSRTFVWLIYVFVRPRSEILSGLPPRALALGPWLLPPFWFTAPFELATDGVSPPVLGRLALAGGSLVLLVAAFGRLASGLGTRLLEPERRRRVHWLRSLRSLRSSRRNAGDVDGGGLALLLPLEGRRLLKLLAVHLRSDWRVGSEILSLPVLALFMGYRSAKPDDPTGGAMIVFLYGWLLFASTDTLTRSRRPASLWWLLVGPVDRGRFSFSTVYLLRLLFLVPATLALLLLGLRAAVALPERLSLLVEMILFGDLMLLLGKVVCPQFPFSLPSRREGGGAGAALPAVFGGALASGVGVGLVLLSRRYGKLGVLAGVLLFLLLHPPTVLWARRRTAEAVAGLEIAEL